MKTRICLMISLGIVAEISGEVIQDASQLSIQQVGSQIQLTWQGANLRPYQIEGGPDLLTWADVGPMQVGADALLGYTHTNSEPRFFYKLREGAMRPGFDDVEFDRNDDKTYPTTEGNGLATELVDIGFAVDYFGVTYTQCYVNNNGNITFDLPLSTFTPDDLSKQSAVMIAPFWADVDTRHPDSGLTRFSSQPGVVGGRPAFGVSWRGVGYFNTRMDKNNSFQMLLINRGDIRAGDFDIEFNYNQIQWETGDASEGSNGLGGSPARVGWDNGSGRFMEYQGSGQTLAFLDQKPGESGPNYSTGLKYQMWGSSVPGRIVIPVRNGIPSGGTGYDFQVSAGLDQDLYASSSTFTLTGSITPSDTTGMTYQWTQVGNPARPRAVIASPLSLTTNVTIPEPGEYIFSLTASKQGTFITSTSDEVLVNDWDVIDVDAGDDFSQTFGDPVSFRFYNAVAKYNGHDIANVEWVQLTGALVTISDTHIIRPWVTPPGPGEYTFRLTARTGGAAQWVITSDVTVTITE